MQAKLFQFNDDLRNEIVSGSVHIQIYNVMNICIVN